MDKPLNILFIHNYYKIAGGEDIVVANEKRLLESYGHHVFLYNRDNQELDSMNIWKKLCFPFAGIFSFKSYRDVKTLIKENNIDIIHAHNIFPLISVSVYYAAKACGVPIVQTLHNFRLLCPNALFYRDKKNCEDCVKNGLSCAIKHKCYRSSTLQSFIAASILRINRMMRAYHHVNAYITLTSFNKQKMSALLPNQKLHVKPNFPFHNAVSNSPEDFTLPERYYLSVGRVEEVKGTSILIEAFKKMPEENLIIIGNGPMSDIVKEIIAKENLSNIIYLGYQEHDVVNDYMKSAYGFIFASQLYESFGLGIVESYSFGVPVIVGDGGNAAGLVISEYTGLIFARDNTDELCACVKRLSGMPDIRKKMSVNALQIYEERYTPEKNYYMLMQIYKDCLLR